jgi:hypothetical protein
MMSPALSAHERSAAALRLLFIGELAILLLRLLGLGALVGAGLLTAALMMTRPSLLSWRPEVTLFVTLSGPLALMAMGLFQYARVPETTGARSSAYVAISLIVLAMASFM